MGKNVLILGSLLVLAVLTPVMVRFITENKTSTVNYAAENATPAINLNEAQDSLTLGSYVTFTTTVPKNIKNPRIEVLCYQDNLFTFGKAGGVGDKFQLGGTSSRWLYEFPDDSADCIANLYYFGEDKGKQTYNPIAKTSFSVPGKQ